MGDTEKVSLGKGRATPKRRDREVRRGGPVAPPPTSKREAAKRRKERKARERATGSRGERQGAGEKLLARDLGAPRAMIRDLIDGRRNMVLLVLPVLFAYVVAGLSGNKAFLNFVFPFYLGSLLLIAFDLFAIKKLVSTRVAADFPEDTQRGHTRYAVMRAISFRRMRVPSPRVSPGPLFKRRSSS